MTERPTAIELFSGCGGLSTGLTRAGFTILSAVEINSVAARSYKANHKDVHVHVEDVCKVTAAALLEENNLQVGELDLLHLAKRLQKLCQISRAMLHQTPTQLHSLHLLKHFSVTSHPLML